MVSQDCPIKTILAIVGFAASAGVPPPELLRAAALDPERLVDPDATLPRSQEIRLWDEAVRLTGDPDFGLHLADKHVSAATREIFETLPEWQRALR